MSVDYSKYYSNKADSSSTTYPKVVQVAVPTPKGTPDINTPQGNSMMPTAGGRSSVPQNSNLVGILLNEFAQISPGYQIEMLRACKNLAIWNADVSYAVENICQLCNTSYKITFENDIPETQVKEMLDLWDEQSRYVYAGGDRALISDLAAQMYTTGALSAELVPDTTLSFLENVVLVDPYYIRFIYNPETTKYDAYQRIANGVGLNINFTEGSLGLVKLNPLQYHYIALRRFADNPYGIPPILASFEGIEIEREMLDNVRHIVRKLGVFGFLSVMVNPPIRKQGESEDAFFARCQQYLNDITPMVEQGYASGIQIGFKGMQENKLEAAPANLAGVKDIFGVILELKMAGLKQDPLMLGRNFNVAETMAKVIMTKLTTQISAYQRVLASFMEYVIKMCLQLNGYEIGRVKVEFEPPMIADRLRDEQATRAEIDNAILMRNAGFIEQDEAAQRLHLNKAAKPGDVQANSGTTPQNPANDYKPVN